VIRENGFEMNSVSAAPTSTEMATDRTWLAHERTLMAWVRTATSMISFGFTVYKFFQFEAGHDTPVTHGWLTPRDFALILISIGLVALFMATLAHRREIKTLTFQTGGRRQSLAEIVAAMISVFGVLLLLSAIFRG
jgi:inner membrane protein YidH